ncbi:hypothetical protein DA83_22435 [Pseudomonas sp. 250J]|nr:hypothetical protein DA83_22435 [Pseudomonas sp. 250J]
MRLHRMLLLNGIRMAAALPGSGYLKGDGRQGFVVGAGNFLGRLCTGLATDSVLFINAKEG